MVDVVKHILNRLAEERNGALTRGGGGGFLRSEKENLVNDCVWIDYSQCINL